MQRDKYLWKEKLSWYCYPYKENILSYECIKSKLELLFDYVNILTSTFEHYCWILNDFFFDASSFYCNSWKMPLHSLKRIFSWNIQAACIVNHAMYLGDCSVSNKIFIVKSMTTTYVHFFVSWLLYKLLVEFRTRNRVRRILTNIE